MHIKPCVFTLSPSAARGTEQGRIATFRYVRDLIAARIKTLIRVESFAQPVIKPPRKTPAFRHGDRRGVPCLGLGHRSPFLH